jgi:hypothetical protein
MIIFVAKLAHTFVPRGSQFLLVYDPKEKLGSLTTSNTANQESRAVNFSGTTYQNFEDSNFYTAQIW